VNIDIGFYKRKRILAEVNTMLKFKTPNKNRLKKSDLNIYFVLMYRKVKYKFEYFKIFIDEMYF